MYIGFIYRKISSRLKQKREIINKTYHDRLRQEAKETVTKQEVISSDAHSQMIMIHGF